MKHEDSAPVEDNEEHTEPAQETEPEKEAEAIPLGPETQAIIIRGIN